MRVRIVYQRPPRQEGEVPARPEPSRARFGGWGRRPVLGLDLGSEALKWVLLRPGLRSKVLASGAIPVKADLAEHLAALRAELAMPTAGVIATVPATRTYFQRLELPFRDFRKMRAAVPFELEQHLPRALEGLSVDALSAEGGCIGLALDPNEFGPLGQQLAAAGLGVRALEPDLLAAARALLLTRTRWGPAGSTVLIDLGQSHAGFAVFERGQLSHLGSLHGGVGGLVEALAERDALPEEEVRQRLRANGVEGFTGADLLLRERMARLRLVLRSKRREPIDLVLTGGGACISGLGEVLAGELGAATVEALRPDGLGPEMAGAWGAAQRAASRSAPCSVRLLSAEPESLPFWTRPRLRIAGTLAAVLVVAGAFDLYQQVASRRAMLEALDQRIERMFRSAAPETTRIVDAPQQLRVRLEEMERRVALFPDPGSNPTHPLAVLAAVTGAVPRSVRLDIFSYTQADDTLHIDGEIDGLGAVTALQGALERLPFVRRVDVGPTRKVVSSDRVGFQMDLTLAGGASEAGS
jgi:general secretion pathway protein L